MKIGLFGGSFDPLHEGHRLLAEAALASGQIDRLIVIPAGRQPFKQAVPTSPARYRFEMAKAAFGKKPRCQISDAEILRPGLSYTLDTVKDFQSAGKKTDQWFLIYGSDVLRDLPHWHKPQELLAKAQLLVGQRAGVDPDQSLRLAAQLRAELGARIQFFAAPERDLSSTAIRAGLQAGDSLTGQMPEEVAAFIRTHQVYRWSEGWAALPDSCRDYLAELERLLWRAISAKRHLHSVNVMMYSVHLAHRHNADVCSAALAGLLHDCAKSMPAEQQQLLASEIGEQDLLDPSLIHAPAGSVTARREYGITQPDILHAIRCHTVASPQMSVLDKILFVADKVEAGRTYDDLAPIRALAETDLDAAVVLTLDEIAAHLRRSGKKPHPYSVAARAALAQSETEVPASDTRRQD